MDFSRSPTSKNLLAPPSQDFKYIGFQTSLQKYKKRLQSQFELKSLESLASSDRTNPRNFKSPTLKKNYSPPAPKVSKAPHTKGNKFRELSQKTLDNDNFSKTCLEMRQDTKESTKLYKTKSKPKCNKDLILSLDCCRKEINWFKTQISKLHNSSAKTLSKKQTIDISEKDISLRLKKQKSLLLKKHKAEIEQQRDELIKSFRVDFDSFHNKIINKLKVEKKKFSELKEKKLQEKIDEEVSSVIRENDKKIMIKVCQAKSAYDRQLKRAEDENFELKKQIDSLKRLLEDSKTKYEIFQYDDKGNNKNFAELKSMYEDLRREYLNADMVDNSLCEKCKAFEKADEEISNKIGALKEYINYAE
ncbi:hypothetical protein SteCoe_23354 [Stentor coeruleus]|uniref:Uncharacterized protein n=1 Tax=Stentor coeruleus TaxID=5963 RepID=A0A1R2BK44_9CILI|nr:hypothetical protein SteCoe_23354 [Stentor coeruleus]